jgi:hypothetical protein
MRRVAGGSGRGAVFVTLALIGLTGCSAAGSHTLRAAGADSETVAEAPASTSTTTTTVPAAATTPTTVSLPGEARTAPTPEPATAAVAVTVAGPPPTAPNPPLEPGVEPDGYGGQGGSRTVTSGTTTVKLSVYPREAYAGEITQISVDVTFVGAVQRIRLDSGDGTFLEPWPSPAWSCDNTAGPKTTGAGMAAFVYARPGRYQVTATVTTAACDVTSPVQAGWTQLTTPEGYPNGPPHPNYIVGHVGNDDVVTVAMTAIARSDRPPPPDPQPPVENCPPEAGGC